MVSSSVVRKLLAEGKVSQANDLLGYQYRIAGQVSSGSRRGAQIGFPTANLTQVATALPREGVYAGLAEYGGKKFAAAVNIGPNPTFGEERCKTEAHLLDFEGDLYGEHLKLEFITRIRDTVMFPNAEILSRQLAEDIAQTRGVVSRQLNR